MVQESFLTLMAEYCEADQARISKWYDAVQQAGFTGTQTPGLRHHISLATFPLNREEEAVRIAQTAAACFAPLTVDIRHMGVMPGGQVLFAAPDMCEKLSALQRACGSNVVGGHLWLPHTTMLIDTVENVAAALPALARVFTPMPARIDRLRLCAFWPKREITDVPLTGQE